MGGLEEAMAEGETVVGGLAVEEEEGWVGKGLGEEEETVGKVGKVVGVMGGEGEEV